MNNIFLSNLNSIPAALLKVFLIAIPFLFRNLEKFIILS